MKNIFYKLLILVIAPIILVNCDDRDLTVMDANATTTISLSSNEVVLDILETGQDVLTVSWTAPDFGFDAAPSYDIIFKHGDLTSPISVGKALSKSFETVELNKILLNIGLVEDEAADVTVMVKSSLGDYNSINSNVTTLKATPYSVSFDPIYMIGEALKGWDPTKAVELRGIGPGAYEVIAEFNNNGTFRYFDAPDWAAQSYNWTYFEGGTVDANLENGNDGDTNLRFIGTTGFYKMNVNLITKTITMEAVDQPKHYMVGAAVPAAGWGWDTPVVMTWVKDGVFTVNTSFVNDAFRFFTKQGDWGSGRNYPYYADDDFEIDSNFENAEDGDKNFKFNGTPGTYTVTVDYFNKTITLSN